MMSLALTMPTTIVGWLIAIVAAVIIGAIRIVMSL